MRVLAIADSDSYLKWGAAALERMPANWQTSLAILATPVLPSPGQLTSALAGTRFSSAGVPMLGLDAIAGRVASERPDVVLLAVRGPVVRVLVRAISALPLSRPVFVSGLPGISVPATRKALHYRAQVDYLVLHSKREVREFTALAATIGLEQSFGLARLPFMTTARDGVRDGRIVFAAQAKVPESRADRMRVLEWLSETARRHPHRPVVIKLRATAGEQQTHREAHPYDLLFATIEDAPPNLTLEAGSMAEHLALAGALVTVSSTAAIEAAALGVPVLVLDDFGVSEEMINLVFEGSDLLGGSDGLIAGEFRRPNDGWLDDNYFHEGSDEDWIRGLEELVRRRSMAPLPFRPQIRGVFGGRLRTAWDRKRALGSHDRTLSGRAALAVGLPARAMLMAVRVPRRLRRKLRARVAAQP